MKNPVCAMPYTTLQCRSVCVGSYKVVAQDLTKASIHVLVTGGGFKFTLPHSNYSK